MEADQPKLAQQLETEIAAISDTVLRSRVQSILVEPAPMRCAWDYGEQGVTYPGWKVAVDPEAQQIGIVYCDYGFGPGRPWGLVFLRDDIPSIGMDSGWFSTFREAAADILDIPASALNVG